MKQIADGVMELDNGNLQLENGIVIPAEKRTRTEVYSRVVGYLRPVGSWNKGKRAEWADREVFDTAKALEHSVLEKQAVSEG